MPVYCPLEPSGLLNFSTKIGISHFWPTTKLLNYIRIIPYVHKKIYFTRATNKKKIIFSLMVGPLPPKPTTPHPTLLMTRPLIQELFLWLPLVNFYLFRVVEALYILAGFCVVGTSEKWVTLNKKQSATIFSKVYRNVQKGR